MEQRADARFERNFYSFLSKRLCRAIRSTMNVQLRDNGRVQKSGRGKSFLLLLEETFESATRLNGRFFDSPISFSSFFLRNLIDKLKERYISDLSIYKDTFLGLTNWLFFSCDR